MKKTYVKPEVYFESFELSASIADNCGKPLNLNQVPAEISSAIIVTMCSLRGTA